MIKVYVYMEELCFFKRFCIFLVSSTIYTEWVLNSSLIGRLFKSVKQNPVKSTTIQ